jgi:hypothetical protein
MSISTSLNIGNAYDSYSGVAVFIGYSYGTNYLTASNMNITVNVSTLGLVSGFNNGIMFYNLS